MAEYSPRGMNKGGGCLQRLQNQASQHHLQNSYARWLPHLVLAMGLPTSSYSRSRLIPGFGVTVTDLASPARCGPFPPTGGHIDLVPKWYQVATNMPDGLGKVKFSELWWVWLLTLAQMATWEWPTQKCLVCQFVINFKQKISRCFLMRLPVRWETCTHLLHRPNTLQCVQLTSSRRGSICWTKCHATKLHLFWTQCCFPVENHQRYI